MPRAPVDRPLDDRTFPGRLAVRGMVPGFILPIRPHGLDIPFLEPIAQVRRARRRRVRITRVEVNHRSPRPQRASTPNGRKPPEGWAKRGSRRRHFTDAAATTTLVASDLPHEWAIWRIPLQPYSANNYGMVRLTIAAGWSPPSGFVVSRGADYRHDEARARRSSAVYRKRSRSHGSHDSSPRGDREF